MVLLNEHQVNQQIHHLVNHENNSTRMMQQQRVNQVILVVYTVVDLLHVGIPIIFVNLGATCRIYNNCDAGKGHYCQSSWNKITIDINTIKFIRLIESDDNYDLIEQ